MKLIVFAITIGISCFSTCVAQRPVESRTISFLSMTQHELVKCKQMADTIRTYSLDRIKIELEKLRLELNQVSYHPSFYRFYQGNRNEKLAFNFAKQFTIDEINRYINAIEVDSVVLIKPIPKFSPPDTLNGQAFYICGGFYFDETIYLSDLRNYLIKTMIQKQLCLGHWPRTTDGIPFSVDLYKQIKVLNPQFEEEALLTRNFKGAFDIYTAREYHSNYLPSAYLILSNNGIDFFAGTLQTIRTKKLYKGADLNAILELLERSKRSNMVIFIVYDLYIHVSE